MDSFATARGAAAAILEVIETSSKIDPLSSSGKTLNCGLSGNIEFRDVFFSYPSRTELIVLRGLNLTIKEGETVALVGSSGSGKSTCLQLLQRFYDPIFGAVHIDGTNIKQYNVNWLRSNIAVVGQEPVLFSGTIGKFQNEKKCKVIDDIEAFLQLFWCKKRAQVTPKIQYKLK